MGLRKTLAIVVLSALPGCSPYVYQTEITTFSNGVTALANSYNSGVQALTADDFADREASWIASQVRLQVLPGCYDLKPIGNPPVLPACGVVQVGQTALPPPTALEIKLQNDNVVFKALSSYSSALQAITNATDNATLTKAVQGTDSALSGLASAVTKIDPTAKANAGVATAAAGLLGEGVTLYLNERRLAALRRIVPPLQDAIATLAGRAGDDLEVIQEQQSGWLQKRITAEQVTLSSFQLNTSATQRQASLTKLDADVAALNQLRSSDPQKTAASLIAAHAALAAALSDPSRQIGPVFDAVSAFATQAEQLNSAITAASSAPAKKS